MKVKLTESFRIRIMLYTCISLLAAVLVDMAVLLFCIRSRILVSDYGLNERMNLHAHSSNYMINNQIHASTKSMLGESDIFYRIFGVGIKVQLIIVLFILALIIFFDGIFSFDASCDGIYDEYSAGSLHNGGWRFFS